MGPVGSNLRFKIKAELEIDIIDYVSEGFEEIAGGTFQGRNRKGYLVATNSVLKGG